MECKQRLYCALGQLIYCVALADNVIQEEEEIDNSPDKELVIAAVNEISGLYF